MDEYKVIGYKDEPEDNGLPELYNNRKQVKVLQHTICRHCGKTFQPRTRRALYCSEACRSYFSRNKRKELGTKGIQGFKRKNTLNGIEAGETKEKPVNGKFNKGDAIMLLATNFLSGRVEAGMNRADTSSTYNAVQNIDKNIIVMYGMMIELHKRLEKQLEEIKSKIPTLY